MSKWLCSIALLIGLMFASPVLAQKPAAATLVTVKQIFPDFPPVKMGMTFRAAKAALIKAGLRPVSPGKSQNEIAWEGTFDGVSGRGTLLFKPRTGVWEIAAVLYALGRQKELADRFTSIITKQNGPATETHDAEYAVSHVWRFKNRLALEVRVPKDMNSPIVDIHWVKE